MVDYHAKRGYLEITDVCGLNVFIASFGRRQSMISRRSEGSARTFFKTSGRARLFALSLVLVAFGAASAHAEVKNVKISLDWIIQGTHAPFFVAQDKGY